MPYIPCPNPMTRRLIDSLYVEAMVLSDEARSYFDGFTLSDRMKLGGRTRVIFSCEALKVTTRLMHSVAWLLSQRAQLESASAAQGSTAALGRATTSEATLIAELPDDAQRIIAGSMDLYDRILRLEAGLGAAWSGENNPAFHLQQRLHQSLFSGGQAST